MPAEANATTLVFAMIETPEGLANVKEICATPGLDGIYVGPVDLAIAVGGAFPGDPAVETEFNAALETIAERPPPRASPPASTRPRRGGCATAAPGLHVHHRGLRPDAPGADRQVPPDAAPQGLTRIVQRNQAND